MKMSLLARGTSAGVSCLNRRARPVTLCLTWLAFLFSPLVAGGQIVRGRVTERTSGQPLSGVVISLERVDGGVTAGAPAMLVSVLSNDAGQYAIRAPGAGRFHLSAKQIGVRRYTTDAFDLAASETRLMDISLEAVTIALPEVKVVATSPGVCALKANEAARLSALWEEARTALTATQISLRDRLFRGRVARYVRELDPRNMRVLSESRAHQQGTFDRPFTLLSGDSLSKVGYWRRLRDSSLVFDAPDAGVLMSPAFQRDHCYSLVAGGRDRRGLIGVAFEPHPDREVPDIRGALWLDARSFELRLVDFRYTRLELQGDTTRVGGEVHFARLPSGAWVVRRWFIRMPQLAHYRAPPLGVDNRTPMVLVRPGIYRFVEEGGDVVAEGIRFFEKPARVVGTVLDSAGRPLPNAVVRLAGTPFSAPADSQGRFVLDSLPPGSHTLIAEHERYAALGMIVGDEEISLDEGAELRVTLRALTHTDMVRRLCDGRAPVRGRATLRLTMVDSQTDGPLAGLSVWLHWTQPDAPANASDAERLPGIRSLTDGKGVVIFCDLPGDVTLELEVMRPNETSFTVARLRLARDEIAGRTVRAKR